MSSDARDFNNIETRAVIRVFFFFLQGKAPKEIHAIKTETEIGFQQGCTNSGLHVARATEFRTLAANICGSSLRNVFHATFLTPKIFRWLLNIFENFVCPWLWNQVKYRDF